MGKSRTRTTLVFAGVLVLLTACGSPTVEVVGGGETPGGGNPAEIYRGPARTAAEMLAFRPDAAPLGVAFPAVREAETLLWQGAETTVAQATAPLPGTAPANTIRAADALAALRTRVETEIATAASTLGLTPASGTLTDLVKTLGMNTDLPSGLFARYAPGTVDLPGAWHFVFMAPVVDPITAMAQTQRLLVEYMNNPIPEIIEVEGIRDSVALFTGENQQLMVAISGDYVYIASDPALLSDTVARREAPVPGPYGTEELPAAGECEAVILAELGTPGQGLDAVLRDSALLPAWIPSYVKQWGIAGASETYDLTAISAVLTDDGLDLHSRGRVRPGSPFQDAVPTELDLLWAADNDAAGYIDVHLSPQARESLLRQIREKNQEGMDPSEAARVTGLAGTILSVVDDEVFFSVRRHDAGIPQLRLVAEVSDTEQVKNLVQLMGTPVTSYRSHAGHELYKVTVGFIQVFYTFSEDRLIGASDEEDLIAFLDRILGADGSPAAPPESIGEADRVADSIVHLEGPKLYESLEFPMMLIPGLREFRSIKGFLPVIHARNTYNGPWHSGVIEVEGSPVLLIGAYLAMMDR